MPRPKRPERIRHQLELDKHLAKHIEQQVDRLMNDYVAMWERAPKPGRRSVARRNRLINDLAALFQKYAKWQLRYKAESDKYLQEYRTALRDFLVRVLVANGIDFPAYRLSRLRVIDRKYSIPRD